MERIDYYEILPQGMEAYLASHGHHFSKAMLDWAVSMMKDKQGRKPQMPSHEQFERLMTTHGQTLERNEGYYDGIYVWCMASSDYLRSSIIDEQHLAMYVKDYIDDIDGNPTRAFDEFYINCVAKGIDIPWQDMI